MGIKHFYGWFRKHRNLGSSISRSKPNVDHLMIDMNGVIHEAAQKTFKYGKYNFSKREIVIPKRLKTSGIKLKPKPTLQEMNLKLFQEVKVEVNRLVEIAKPSKTVFMAIDGVAPMSKQNQQRQRRFKAGKERTENDSSFDSICITAGTSFMKELSKSLLEDGWLLSDNPLNVFLSDDSSPGEGEHKIMDSIRLSVEDDDVFCVVGMDADLILLCCTLQKTNVFIMRENEKKDFSFINIGKVKKALKTLSINVDDLIIWSCFIGNDFLPPIPTLEIRESAPEIGALEFFFQNYQKPLIDSHGYLNIFEIIRLLKLVQDREQAIMDARRVDEERIKNPLWQGDINQYRIDFREQKVLKYCSAYCSDNFHLENEKLNERLVHDFMKTVQWVHKYYTKGINATQAWSWFFPFNYALHANYFVEYLKVKPIISYRFEKTKPSHPHEQLLRVVPISSKALIPENLQEYAKELAEKNTLFEIDLSGKRQEWEAVVIVNFVKIENFREHERNLLN
jgi:5'-3' exonuclease